MRGSDGVLHPLREVSTELFLEEHFREQGRPLSDSRPRPHAGLSDEDMRQIILAHGQASELMRLRAPHLLESLRARKAQATGPDAAAIARQWGEPECAALIERERLAAAAPSAPSSAQPCAPRL